MNSVVEHTADTAQSNTQSNMANPDNVMCPICLENKDFHFKCSTCNEGGFCVECYTKISPHSLPFEGVEVRDMIKCPCCRSPNWYWLFDEVLSYFVEDVDSGYDECYNILKNPCMYVYKKNRDENYTLTKFKAFYDEVMNLNWSGSQKPCMKVYERNKKL
jgi:hypothetical protein